MSVLFDKSKKNRSKAYRTPPNPLKWHGGKAYDARWIIEKMPPHQVYVEPFFGSGKVLFARDPHQDWFAGHPEAEERDGKLLAKDRGCSEIANDVYGELMNFWTSCGSGTLWRVRTAGEFDAVFPSLLRPSEDARR